MDESSPKPSGSPAPPKQVAYLNYMGMTARNGMTAEEASMAISRLEGVEDYEEWRQLVEKKARWQTDRFLLHPGLFSTELQTYLEKELPAILTSYVRSHMPEATRLLTPAGIRATFQSLARQNPTWWRSPQRQHLFLTELVLRNPEIDPWRKAAFGGVLREKITRWMTAFHTAVTHALGLRQSKSRGDVL